MTQLFINSYLTHDYKIIGTKIELVLIMWLIVLIAIVIDLVSGLRKAKLLGEVQTSYGFRRTVSKMIQYYSLLCFAFMFDVLASLVLSMSYFSILASLFLVFIEAKSVLEKAQEKDRRRMNESIRDLLTLVENKDNLLKGVSEILKEKENTNVTQINQDKHDNQ